MGHYYYSIFLARVPGESIQSKQTSYNPQVFSFNHGERAEGKPARFYTYTQSVECNQALWLVSCMCLFGSALNTNGMYMYSIESPYFRLSNLDDCIKCHYFNDADPRHNSTEPLFVFKICNGECFLRMDTIPSLFPSV